MVIVNESGGKEQDTGFIFGPWDNEVILLVVFLGLSIVWPAGGANYGLNKDQTIGCQYIKEPQIHSFQKTNWFEFLLLIEILSKIKNNHEIISNLS